MSNRILGFALAGGLAIASIPFASALAGTHHYGAGETRAEACREANQSALRHCEKINRCWDACRPSRDCKTLDDGSFECGAHVHHHRGSCEKNGAPRCS